MNFSLSDAASAATAIALLFAAVQLWLSKKQAVTAFEDALSKEYRELAARLPTKALLGEPLSPEEHGGCIDEMYHYFDLCNHQVFLANKKRISRSTWVFWRDGIKSNLSRPAFEQAWAEIAARSSGDFSELRSVAPPKPWEKPNGIET